MLNKNYINSSLNTREVGVQVSLSALCSKMVCIILKCQIYVF